MFFIISNFLFLFTSVLLAFSKNDFWYNKLFDWFAENSTDYGTCWQLIYVQIKVKTASRVKFTRQWTLELPLITHLRSANIRRKFSKFHFTWMILHEWFTVCNCLNYSSWHLWLRQFVRCLAVFSQTRDFSIALKTVESLKKTSLAIAPTNIDKEQWKISPWDVWIIYVSAQ